MSRVYYGRVKKINFSAPPSRYILRMQIDGIPDVIAVKGNIAGLPVKVDSWFGFEANEVIDPKYGKQLDIVRAPVLEMWDDDKAFRALVSHEVSGMSLSLVRSHSNGDMVGLLGDLDALKQVKGLSTIDAMHIHEQWRFCQAYYQTFNLLNQLNVPASLCEKVWSTFGERTQQVLSTDPWELIALDFQLPLIDQIATALRLPLSSPSRTRALVLHALRSGRDFGHLFIDLPTLTNRIHGLDTSLTVQQISTTLAELHKTDIVFADRKTRAGTTAVYEKHNHKAEESSAALLRTRLVEAAWDKGDRLDFWTTHLEMALTSKEGAAKTPRALVPQVVSQWSKANNLTLSKAQEQGIANALLHPVSVITGLPGTGKTTSLRLLVRILQAAQVNFLLVAPTGIAAKRLHNVTGAQASTIHRAFGSKGQSEEARNTAYEGILDETTTITPQRGVGEWEYGSDNPHPAQYVIVDESSMVDQALLERLLSSTASNCRVVMVGDAAQLPSVGPGNVLRDLIASRMVPVTSLHEIFRQEQISDIVVAAHQIHKGEVPSTQTPDFALIEIDDEELVLHAVMWRAKKLEDDKVNYQIISPRHAGTLGVTNLNTQLRELLNPRMEGKTEINVGKSTMRQNDRVMVIKNNYNLKVFNGDLGRITKIDHNTKEITVTIDGPSPQVVRFEDKDASLLRLAYASTVHKCQGQEWEQIVMPVVPAFGQQLQRNLLYTAITRARSKVTLVGSSASLAKAVHNDKESARNTLFVERLTVPPIV